MQGVTDCESLGCTEEYILYGVLLSPTYALLCLFCGASVCAYHAFCLPVCLSLCRLACVRGRISPFFKYISRSICLSMCARARISRLYTFSRSFRVWCLFTLHWSLRKRDIKELQQILLNDFIITKTF